MKASRNIDEYIKTFPKDIQVKLQSIQKLIKELAPNAIETISYGMPTFKLNGKNLVHFAGYKNHIGFYPTPQPIEKFEKDLISYKYSKGAIQFPLDKPMPMKLIEKIVRYRIKENSQKI